MIPMAFGAARMPRNLVFGAGQRAALPLYVRPLGQRVLIVTDARLAADPALAEIEAGLAAAGCVVSTYSGTVAELPAENIADALAHGKQFGAEVIVGIGGGSCMDAAKVVALLLAHGGKPADYYGELKVPGPVLPLVAVPTTAGTGSEVTPVAVVSDPDRAVKVGIASPHLIPLAAICDPELTWSCPPGLTAVSGADALTHAIEAFTTLRRDISGTTVHEHVFVGKNVISDHFALEAIKLIGSSLKRAYDDGADHDARARLMLGATLAGLAFGTAGTAAAHAVQYPVGALTHTPHGAGVAVMMPYVMAFNRDHAEAEMAEIAHALGADVAGLDRRHQAQAAIDAVAALFASVGIPRTIRDLGMSPDKLAWTAEAALGASRLIKNNPRPLDLASMTLLVNAAYSGDASQLAAGL